MPYISKITLANGITYDIKDASLQGAISEALASANNYTDSSIEEVLIEVAAQDTTILTEAQAYTNQVKTALQQEIDTNTKAIQDESARAQQIEASLGASLDTKVNRIKGKGLSTNDFTDEEKDKLASIRATIDEQLSDTSENALQNRVVTQALLTKQDKILGTTGQIVGFNEEGALIAYDVFDIIKTDGEIFGSDEVNEICGLLNYIVEANDYGLTVIAKSYTDAENNYGTTGII